VAVDKMRDAGLQIGFSCASAVHVPQGTLRCGSQKNRFSPQPDAFYGVGKLYP
jgi:hypothetical protein